RVRFTDIVGRAALGSRLGDAEWGGVVERHHALVRRELARHHGRELDPAGDGFFAAFDGPARAVQAAGAIVESLQAIDVEIRAGLHTGECEVADGKLAGVAVSIGARVAAPAAPRAARLTRT